MFFLNSKTHPECLRKRKTEYLLRLLVAALHSGCEFADFLLRLGGVGLGVRFPVHGRPLLLPGLMVALLTGLHLEGGTNTRTKTLLVLV